MQTLDRFAYVNFVGVRDLADADAVSTDLTWVQAQVADARPQFLRLLRAAYAHRGRLLSGLVALAGYAEDYRRLKTLPKVETIRASHGAIEVLTAPLAIEHAGHSRAIGPYRITLRVRDGELRISRDGEHGRGHPHPNVSQAGDPALGTVHVDVLRLIAAHRLSDVFEILIDFLQSFSAGAYVPLDDFLGRQP
jgi:hypothetical protein